MSAPHVLRLALEACRPVRTSPFRLQPLRQTRAISNTRWLAAQNTPGDVSKIQTNEKSQAPTPKDPTATSFAPDSLESKTSENASAQAAAPASKAEEASKSEVEFSAKLTPAANGDGGDLEPGQMPEPEIIPPNVLATYLAPMRHKTTHGIPVASLQLRSYSVRNLEFFADFCMRAAFYLKMPASGPVPLPKRTERWTTLRSNFVNKKSQENFERITHKRSITVMDADKATVEVWLAFVRKWQFYGVGLKANVWEHEGVDVVKNMDKMYETEISKDLDQKLGLYGWNSKVEDGKPSAEKLYLDSQKRRNVQGAPMANVRPLWERNQKAV